MDLNMHVIHVVYICVKMSMLLYIGKHLIVLGGDCNSILSVF